MSNPATLDKRIVNALTKPLMAHEARAVLTEAEAVFADLERNADELDAKALSPLLDSAEARTIRQQAAELRFESDRLDAGVSALRARVSELEEAEAEATRQKEYDAALLERDKLAGEIAKEYPRIVRELTALVKAIAENEERCQAAGITDKAEAIGRGVPGNFYQVGGSPITRLRDINLPMPDGRGHPWKSPNMLGRPTYQGLQA